MIRAIAILTVASMFAGCSYNATTGDWEWMDWHEMHERHSAAGDQENSVGDLLAIQGYMREHDGKMPPPDARINGHMRPQGF